MRFAIASVLAFALGCAAGRPTRTAHYSASSWREDVAAYADADKRFRDAAASPDAGDLYQRRAEVARRLRSADVSTAEIASLLLSDRQEDRRAGLVLTLVRDGTPRELVPFLLRVLADEQDVLLRTYAALVLAAAPARDLLDASDVIARTAVAEADLGVRVTLLPAIMKLSPADRLRVIIDDVKQPDEGIRRAAYFAAKAEGFAPEVVAVLSHERRTDIVRALEAFEREVGSPSAKP